MNQEATHIEEPRPILMVKRNPEANQQRFYRMRVGLNLFREWYLFREWGRIGNRGGQTRSDYWQTLEEAVQAFERVKREKLKRGYFMAEGV